MQLLRTVVSEISGCIPVTDKEKINEQNKSTATGPLYVCMARGSYIGIGYSLGIYTPISNSTSSTLGVYASALGKCINLRIGYNTSNLGIYFALRIQGWGRGAGHVLSRPAPSRVSLVAPNVYLSFPIIACVMLACLIRNGKLCGCPIWNVEKESHRYWSGDQMSHNFFYFYFFCCMKL